MNFSVNKPYFTGLLIITIALWLYKYDLFNVVNCYNPWFGTQTEKEFYNRTKADEHQCDRVVKLAEYDQLPIVYLNSFPGSGNT